MVSIYKLIRPFLFLLDAENIHDFVVCAGKISQEMPPFNFAASKFCRVEDERLRTDVFGMTFDNPVGLAAGFDKNAELIDFFYDLGFGFSEVGTLSRKPGKGNDKPRVFRLVDDEALINNMGLPNKGIDNSLVGLSKQRKYPVGVNIAQSSDESMSIEEAISDFAYSYQRAAPFADYIALNISCPNVKDGKIFENPAALDSLLQTLKKENKTSKEIPLLVKLSPDLQDKHLEELIGVCQSHSVDGYIISNTQSISYRGKNRGLSGLPIQKASTSIIRKVYSFTEGKTPIIGCGGIDSAESAYEKIKAGACLVQLYTGFIYQGPLLVKRINKELLSLIENQGYSRISQAVGK